MATRHVKPMSPEGHFRRLETITGESGLPSTADLLRRCSDGFKDVSPLPVVDMIAVVSAAVKQRGLKRIGILGTRTVMETRFFGGVTSAEIVPPSGNDLDGVHDAYVTMAASGVVTAAQRAVFTAACQRLLKDGGVEAIMLGGTDLALIFNEQTTDFPLVDCAGIHVEAIVRLGMG
jgi:aspartate racemase